MYAIKERTCGCGLTDVRRHLNVDVMYNMPCMLTYEDGVIEIRWRLLDKYT